METAGADCCYLPLSMLPATSVGSPVARWPSLRHGDVLERHVLDPFFRPSSVAVFGASERAGSVGAQVYRNLREAGFASSQIEIVEVQALLSFASGRALIDMLREGTVQTAAVINAQPAERIDAIVGEVERAIERYRVGDVLRVPALALLVCAVKD